MSTNFILPDDFDPQSMLASLTDVFGAPDFSAGQSEALPDFSSSPVFADPLPINEAACELADRFFLSFCTRTERSQKEIVAQLSAFKGLWDDTFENNESMSSLVVGEQKRKITRAPMINPPQRAAAPAPAADAKPAKAKEERKQAKEAPVAAKAPVVQVRKSTSKTAAKPKKDKEKEKDKKDAPHAKGAAKGAAKGHQKRPSQVQQKYVIKKIIKPPSVPPKPPGKSSATAKVVGKLSMDKMSMLSKVNFAEAPPPRSRLVRASGNAEGAQFVSTQEQEQHTSKPQQHIVRTARKRGARPPSAVSNF